MCDHSFDFFFKQCGHTRGSYGQGEAPVSNRGVAPGRPANLLLFTVQCIHASRNPLNALRLRRFAKSGGLARVLVATALSLGCRAHFRTGARRKAKGNLVFWWSRRKGSERLYSEK